MKAKCYCCQQELDRSKFIAGHVVAIANGGTDKLDNLEIVCADCNNSMGTKNMYEYKEKYYL